MALPRLGLPSAGGPQTSKGVGAAQTRDDSRPDHSCIFPKVPSRDHRAHEDNPEGSPPL